LPLRPHHAWDENFFVEVISIGFVGNQALHRAPRQLWPLRKSPDQPLTAIWNSIVVPEYRLRHITVEQLIGAVDRVSYIDPSWRSYLLERYGV
jgi:hypothetical protein